MNLYKWKTPVTSFHAVANMRKMHLKGTVSRDGDWDEPMEQ
jgi:hypothetical protein